MLPGDLENEAGWELADLTGGPDLGSRASTRQDYERLWEACSAVNESVTSSAADLLSLVVRSVPLKSWGSILYVRVSALESTFSSSYRSIWELQSQLGSNNSVSNETVAHLKSAEQWLRFTEIAASHMQRLAQSQEPQLREV